jgi:predicted RNase H-like HicB family nuclease
MEYVITLTPGEDGYIVAECPQLPGCVSQGKTEDEALNNIKEAIQGIVELRRDMPESVTTHKVRILEIAA